MDVLERDNAGDEERGDIGEDGGENVVFGVGFVLFLEFVEDLGISEEK